MNGDDFSSLNGVQLAIFLENSVKRPADGIIEHPVTKRRILWGSEEYKELMGKNSDDLK